MMKKIPVCPNCGMLCSWDAQICPNCHQPIHPEKIEPFPPIIKDPPKIPPPGSPPERQPPGDDHVYIDPKNHRRSTSKKRPFM
jgi:hypothetical protein